ncbi:MAG: hypothetical protein ACR2JY_08585 [Chloroflexota bacterium]
MTVGVGTALLTAPASELVAVLVAVAVAELFATVVDTLAAEDAALVEAAALVVTLAVAVLAAGAVAGTAAAVVGAADDWVNVDTVADAPQAERPTAARIWALALNALRRDTYRWDHRVECMPSHLPTDCAAVTSDRSRPDDHFEARA